MKVELLIVLWLASMSLIPAGGCSIQPAVVDPLPSIADIENIHVACDEPSMEKPLNFAISRSHWEAVLSTLRPAYRDNQWANWQVLGKATITRKTAGPLMVFLFDVSAGPGAFALGETWEKRIYFRGGDSAELKKALLAALADAK